MRFNLLAIFWFTAGAAFVVEHVINLPSFGEAPSLTRFVWIMTFLPAWAVLGRFWIRMRA